MGEGQQGVELVRAGLAMALEHGLVGPAAEIYQRLADALEHAGDYAGASATYDEAYSFCAANTLEPSAQLCLAGLTVVLRLSATGTVLPRCAGRSLGPPMRRPMLGGRYRNARIDNRVARPDQAGAATTAGIDDHRPRD
jgi:hypothetical protein